MELVREVVGLFVIIIGFVGWTISLPQMHLIYRMKKSESLSLLSSWGGFAATAIILVHILLQTHIDWKLALVYFVGLICSIVFLSLIYYYRRWPGGRATHTTTRG